MLLQKKRQRMRDVGNAKKEITNGLTPFVVFRLSLTPNVETVHTDPNSR